MSIYQILGHPELTKKVRIPGRHSTPAEMGASPV
jgi:hypothetical protein